MARDIALLHDSNVHYYCEPDGCATAARRLRYCRAQKGMQTKGGYGFATCNLAADHDGDHIGGYGYGSRLRPVWSDDDALAHYQYAVLEEVVVDA